jgi:hypothetical protein
VVGQGAHFAAGREPYHNEPELAQLARLGLGTLQLGYLANLGGVKKHRRRSTARLGIQRPVDLYQCPQPRTGCVSVSDIEQGVARQSGPLSQPLE